MCVCVCVCVCVIYWFDSMWLQVDEREEADVLVSHEDIVSRLSNAYQKTDELCIPVSYRSQYCIGKI